MGAIKYLKKKHYDDGEVVREPDTKKISTKGKRMVTQARKDMFRCAHCRREILKDSISTKHRNHCPFCLYSLHVDESPGDRRSVCHGSMKPIGFCIKQHGGELSVIHECQKCGVIKINRIAAEDDDEELVRIFNESQNLPKKNIDAIKKARIELLRRENESVFYTIIFGKLNN